jgi:hypothetical protein
VGIANLIVRSFVSGIPTARRGGRYLLMLQACIDDSGSEPKSPNFVLAGFVANVSQWERFTDLWEAKLHENPRIEYFKMSEAMGLHEQFKDFAGPERDEKVMALAQLAHDHIEARVDCVIARTDYDDLIKPIAGRRFRFMKDPYFLCFYALIRELSEFHFRIGLPHVNMRLVFDKHGKVGHRALRYWHKAREIIDPERAALLNSEPYFEDDFDFNPLQAADMYAWIIRDRLLPKDQHPLAYDILAMFADKLPVQDYIGRKDLEKLKSELMAILSRP